MKTLNHIELVNNFTKKEGTTFILPNGYGVLSYTETLAKAVSTNVKRVIVPVLSGQNKRNGLLNIETAKNDFIKIFLSTTINSNDKISIISHCSSMLYLAEINDDKIWENVDKIILYSFLANPLIHYDRFKIKAKLNGVSLAKESYENLIKFNDISIYENIPVPIYVIHPKTSMNRFRASSNDLNTLRNLKNVVSVDEPIKGYEISNAPQNELVDYIVKEHLSQLL